MKRTGSIDFGAYMQFARQVDEQPELAGVELTSVEQHRDEIIALYRDGFKRGCSTGWRCLDEYITIRRGEFTVITGIPGHGKSSWLDNLMIHLSRFYKWRWAVFSAENFPISRHIAGLMEIYSGKPFTQGPTERMNKNELELCIAWVGRYFRFLQPAENSYSLNRIVQLAAHVEDLDALVIDPWNELDHSRPNELREDEYISRSLSKLRWLARAAGIHVFVVAHPSKYHREKGEKKPVITLNDVKGASEWYAKADNGISIWRDEGERNSPTEVHVQKIRFREVGRIGKADLWYDRISGRFTDPNHRPTIDELMSQEYGAREKAKNMGWLVEREAGDEVD